MIRYEDLFDENYLNIKKIFNEIGFKYTANIINIPDNKPANTEQMKYRTYQINQPFINNNIGQIYLTKEYIDIIKNNNIINIIYPNIKELISQVKIIDNI